MGIRGTNAPSHRTFDTACHLALSLAAGSHGLLLAQQCALGPVLYALYMHRVLVTCVRWIQAASMLRLCRVAESCQGKQLCQSVT